MLLPKNKPVRDKPFRKWIASLPCLRCGLHNRSQAAHFGKGGWSMKGGDDTVRPLCADNYGYVGCHTKMDQSLDSFWALGKKQRVIDAPVYETWKAGDKDKAAELMGEWREVLY